MAIKIPLHTNIAKSKITIAHPTNPNSSDKIENIKSLCGSGMYKNFCLLSPSPAPNNPPEPIAYKLCTTWYPVPLASAHGSKNVCIRSNLNPPLSRHLHNSK